MASLYLAYLAAMLMLATVGLVTWRTSGARRRHVHDVHAPGAPFHDPPPHVQRIAASRRDAPFDQDRDA